MAGVGVIGVLDGVAEDADDADNLAGLPHSVRNVAGVTDQLLAAGHLRRHQKTYPNTPLGGCGAESTLRAGTALL